ncbi:MAG: CatB-related O-acetyltransferase [Spirochaetaceae bacterium]|jgi:virginiamycin A acetyltransferase|nr:CatB-related O-acetyltransferase [Spirochaetaceae bacterium]
MERAGYGMSIFGPDPDSVYPNPNNKSICFIKNVVKNPHIIAGDYSYYEDPQNPEDFESRVTYFDPSIGDKLIIGKFCGIAQGVEFVMNGLNRRMGSVTAYPFHLMGKDWEQFLPSSADTSQHKDTVIGNDVMIHRNVTILPGVHIDDGAIIMANSVVSTDIPPYWVAGGNPVRIIRKRFDDDLIKHLLEIQWWNWPAEKIFKNLDLLSA